MILSHLQSLFAPCSVVKMHVKTSPFHTDLCIMLFHSRWDLMKEPFHAFCFSFSCSLAEKEIPILVKQEPVEIKEPIIEADKFKSRYKKFIPPLLPSPVSWIVLSFKCRLLSQVNPAWCSPAGGRCWWFRLLSFRWIWLCVWFVVAVEKRTGCYCATAVMTATTPSAWSPPWMTSRKETGGAPSVWPRLGSWNWPQSGEKLQIFQIFFFLFHL